MCENLSIYYSKIDSLLEVWARNDFRATGVASVGCFSLHPSLSYIRLWHILLLSLSLFLPSISEAVEFVEWRGYAKIGLYFIKWEAKFSAACKFTGFNPDVHFNTSFLFAPLSLSSSRALPFPSCSCTVSIPLALSLLTSAGNLAPVPGIWRCVVAGRRKNVPETKSM